MSGILDTIVNVNISITSATPSRADFGTPLALAYHTHNTDLVRTYFDLPGMVSDGFSTTEPAYLIAQAFMSQNPRPPSFKVGRLTTAVAQTFTLLVTDHTDGHKVGLTLVDSSGVKHDVYVTVSSQTTAQVATALATALAAVAGITSATASSSTITVTLTTAGAMFYPSAAPNDSTTFTGGFQGVTFTDTTSTASPQTDLANILLVDPAWYGVTCQAINATDIAAVATWVESNSRILCYNSSDGALLTTGGILGTLKAAGYKRSFGLYTNSPNQYSAAGLMANRFTAVPGGDTWFGKFIAGATADNLTPTQMTNITGDNGNYYINIGGSNAVFDGRSSQGQFMDIQRGLDALIDDIRVNQWIVMQSAEKVPYTRKGIALLGSALAASLARFTATESQPNRFLTNEPPDAPEVLLPDYSSIAPADKLTRKLRGLNFTAKVSGAIQSVIINGNLSY